MGLFGIKTIKTKQGRVTYGPLTETFRAPGLGEINLSEIEYIGVEDGSAVESRVTLTRLALIGILAFGFKKKRGGEKYIIVETLDKMVALEVDRKQEADARRFVLEVKKGLK